MCGICGVASPGKTIEVSKSILEKMNNAMLHRGPDGEGYYINDQVGLGSRRLSIIDVNGGDQPISNEDKSIWIVFNGEIYNYRELREHLMVRGHVFQTQTDTEVIIHLYEEFGLDCVQHLNGIFAFSLWDDNKKQLFLARDRMGVKPLYYTTLSDGQFVFGSEMKVVLANPKVQRDLDLTSLNEFLSYEYVPTPRTIIRNIWRLEAGTILVLNKDGLKKEAFDYISFRQAESRPPVDYRDYAQGLYNVVRDSVEQELVSDVPVGVLLSGGIDSSTIAAMMVDCYPGKVQSFSIGFEESSFDESYYARKVSRLLGTQHNEMILTSKMAVDLVGKMTSVIDEPFADSSFIPTYLLSQYAHNYVKVVLGGDGGDELFGGYPTLLAHQLIQFYEMVVPWSIRANLAPKVIKGLSVSFDNISLDFRIRRFLGGRGVPLIARHQRWLGSFVDEEKDELLQDWIKPVLRETYYQSFMHARECDAQLPLDRILYNDLKTYLEGDILFKVDRASMANSLEVRVPFLNRNVVSFANDLPFDLKRNGITGKFILKKAMKSRLPGEIINRPKKGFNMPVAYWLSGELKTLMLEMLSETYIKKQNYFNYKYTNQLIDDHLSRRKDNRKLLWTLLMFQMWYSNYLN